MTAPAGATPLEAALDAMRQCETAVIGFADLAAIHEVPQRHAIAQMRAAAEQMQRVRRQIERGMGTLTQRPT